LAHNNMLELKPWLGSTTREITGPTPVDVGPVRLGCGLGALSRSVAGGYEVQLEQYRLLDISHRRNVWDVQVEVGPGHAGG